MANVKHRYGDKEYREVVFDSRIKHKDFFHMKHLYILMHEWLVEEGWATRHDVEFPEQLYLQREHQKAGRELWIWWRMRKVPSKNTYYRYDLDIDIHVILLKDVEVMHNNLKYKANWGEPEIKLFAKIVSDYQDKWKNHWLLKHFQTLFWKKIFFKDFEMHRKELYRDIYRFMEALKSYLKLKTYLPEPESQQFYMDEDFG